MNDINVCDIQLPDTIEGVRDFVVINEEKLNAVKAAIRYAKKTGDINLEELERQQRELEITTVQAQCRLGELTKEIPKAKNQYEMPVQGSDKQSQLLDLGITKQRASEYERMAENREIVDEVIASGEHVTKSAILRKISEKACENKRTQEEIDAISSDIEGQYVKQIDEETYGIYDCGTNELCTTYEIESKKPHVSYNTHDDNEWYTPIQYLESAREVLGTINLDPASNEFANERVQAEMYYTEDDNGLNQEWYGNIWLNPPYSSDSVKPFAEKLVNSNFDEAIVLVNNATETEWFNILINKASAIVFPKGRIQFDKRDGKHGSPLQGQAFIYYGEREEMFLKEFLKYGWGSKLNNGIQQRK